MSTTKRRGYDVPQLMNPWIGGLALTLAAFLVESVRAQDQPPAPAPDVQQPLIPPVPLESGPVQSFATRHQITPPVSIGPAPGYFPAPLYLYDGRPVLYGRPVRGVVVAQPVFIGPITHGPTPFAGPATYTGPAPIAGPAPGQAEANFAPTGPVLDPDASRAAIEPVRSAGPANFRMVLSETFLNRTIARDRVEPAPVRDVILGAQVTGQQTTVSRLRLDLVPSQFTGRGVFVLNGDVQSQTTGVTSQAMIDTSGQQQFVAMKDVFFDGDKLSTRHATVYVRANNQTVGATTAFSGTLFGGLSERIAYRVAERQKAASEAVVRDRVAERVFPTFDGEVDARLAQANQQLTGQIRKALEAVKLLPASQSVWTTDTHLYYEGLIGAADSRPTIPQPRETVDGEAGLRIMIHDSLLNTLVDRAGLKGFKTTDRFLRQLEQPYLVKSAGGPSGSKGTNPGSVPIEIPPPALPIGTDKFETEIVFDDTDPVTMRLEDDRLVVTYKATFKPNGQSLVPPMAITVPYQTRIVGDKIRLTAGKPRVVAQDRADPDEPQTIVESMIEQLIQAELVPLEFDRRLPAAYWPASGPAPLITSIKSENGWVTIAVE